MKKFVIIGAVVVIAVIAFLILRPNKKNEAYTFETAKVEKGKISNIVTATGTIEAVTSIEVGTQVSGIIEKIYVDFNDIVKQGQLLAQLDKKQLTAQLEQSSASLDQAKAQLTYQEATFTRLKALYEKKLIAQSDYDQALYNYENAKSSVKNAQSSYDRNKVNLDYSTISSPIDGVVLNRAIEEGQTVAASFNTPTLFTIVNDLTQMEVETSVDEADIGKVKEGQRVEFTVDAYSEKKFEGKVSEVRIQPTTTNNVVTYSVILSAPNPDKELMPGMTASAIIYVEEKDSVLMLAGKATRFSPDMTFMQTQFEKMMKDMPDSVKAKMPGGGAMRFPTGGGQRPSGSAQMGAGNASGMGGGGFQMPQGMSMPANVKRVWIKDDKGGIRPTTVTTGIDNGNFVEIVKGLKEGDEVIVSMSNSSKKEEATTNRPRGPFMF